MRLFIAIHFTPEIRNQLTKTITQLKLQAIQGRFTRSENLHMTLVFLGEVESPAPFQKLLHSCTALSSTELLIKGIGKFRRTDGDLYWAGIEQNPHILQYYNTLCRKLKEIGFLVEDRPLTPHITLGREVILKNQAVLPDLQLTMPVSSISLMRSQRIQGKLVYTELDRVQLNE